MSEQISKAYERAQHYMATNANDEIASEKPLLVGVDRNGHTGIVFPTNRGMAVEVNLGLPTSHGALHAEYVPVSFAKACYR